MLQQTRLIYVLYSFILWYLYQFWVGEIMILMLCCFLTSSPPLLFVHYKNLPVSAVMIIPWHLTDSLLLLCARNLILYRLDILVLHFIIYIFTNYVFIAVLPILGYDDNSIAPGRLDDTGLYWHSIFLQHYMEHSAATLCCIVCHATVLFICCLCVL